MKKGTYKHFKGKLYNVVHIAKHSETQEEYVVYINANDDTDAWIRPKEMFLEVITRDGKTFPRFEFIG